MLLETAPDGEDPRPLGALQQLPEDGGSMFGGDEWLDGASPGRYQCAQKPEHFIRAKVELRQRNMQRAAFSSRCSLPVVYPVAYLTADIEERPHSSPKECRRRNSRRARARLGQ